MDFLSNSGVHAVHWSAVGHGNESDAELMRWAGANGFIVLTADLDFSAILAATQRRWPSVIQIRSEVPTPSTIGKALLAAIRQAEAELERGAVLSLDTGRARLRILPFS